MGRLLLEPVIITRVKPQIYAVEKHALKRGYDLSRLRARQLHLQDFVEFDLILAMDFENLSNIQSLMRRAEAELGSLRAEIALMSEHDPHYTQQELPDPYYGEADRFRAGARSMRVE